MSQKDRKDHYIGVRVDETGQEHIERAMEAGLATSQSDAVRKGLARLGKSAERLLRKIA